MGIFMERITVGRYSKGFKKLRKFFAQMKRITDSQNLEGFTFRMQAVKLLINGLTQAVNNFIPQLKSIPYCSLQAGRVRK